MEQRHGPGTRDHRDLGIGVARHEPGQRLTVARPELKALLSQNGVSDYSIYWDKETNILFAFQKTEGGAGSQDLGNTEIVQKWWDYMADIMEVNPDNSPVSIPLPEVFHMD